VWFGRRDRRAKADYRTAKHYDTAHEHGRGGGADSDVYRGSERDTAIELSVEQERDRDFGGNWHFLYNSAHCTGG